MRGRKGCQLERGRGEGGEEECVRQQDDGRHLEIEAKGRCYKSAMSMGMKGRGQRRSNTEQRCLRKLKCDAQARNQLIIGCFISS